MVLRVGFVREHFSSPLLQYYDAQETSDRLFELVECPGGTGQLITRLKSDEIDVAIALTDALISGIANGVANYKLVGSYVTTPLNWAVITGRDTSFQDITSLKNTTLGISRPGSGSQVMAYVMALQQGWSTTDINFKVNNDIHGLIDSVNDGSTSAFMWEWFTTKPYLDSGKVKFIGSVPTPWPSWLIAAHPSSERAPPGELKRFLTDLTTYVRSFDSEEARSGSNVDYIKQKFGYPEEDIKAWMRTVGYPENCLVIPTQVITETLSVLEKAGVVKAPEGGFNVDGFVNDKIVDLS